MVALFVAIMLYWQAKRGDQVAIHYKGQLDDGTVFDSSAGREPLEFQIGANQVIPGFEAAVMGLDVGQKRATRIEPDQAYGPRRDEMVITVLSLARSFN